MTAGRIVGLASSTVDGTPALLVYTRSDGRAQVTAVTGCNGDQALGRAVGRAEPLIRRAGIREAVGPFCRR